MCVTCVCSYFDGELPKEVKQEIDSTSEEEEEELSSGQKKAANKKHR